MPVKPRIKFAPGKTYVYSGSEGVYSVIAGELLEGDSVASGGNLAYGNGSPSAGNGKDGDVYLDLTDFKVHTKSGGAWGSGTLFKGTNGSNGAAGSAGNRIRWGNGAPSNGDGDNDDLYLDLTDFKIHTKGSGSWGVGNAFKGATGSAGLKGATLLQGSGVPGSGTGDDGDTFLDVTNHIVYKKSGGSWASQGSSFKGATGSTGASGSKGSDGLRGKVTLEGAGAPGTGSNLATPTAALTDALTDASLSSGDLATGDLYLDTTNHRFYKKTALGWATRGLSFVGPAGSKGDTGTTGSAGTKGDTGDTGATGPGLAKHSAALGADTYLSSQSDATTFTTSGNLAYPTVLLLNDPMENVGSVVTRGGHTWTRRVATTATGSKFTIDSAGRYKIDYTATFNFQASAATSNTVDITAFIDYSTDDGATFTTMATQTITVTTESTTTGQTTVEMSKTIFLPAATTVFFKAKRGNSTISTKVTANAITKSEVGEDTFVVITKL